MNEISKLRKVNRHLLFFFIIILAGSCTSSRIKRPFVIKDEDRVTVDTLCAQILNCMLTVRGVEYISFQCQNKLLGQNECAEKFASNDFISRNEIRWAVLIREQPGLKFEVNSSHKTGNLYWEEELLFYDIPNDIIESILISQHHRIQTLEKIQITPRVMYVKIKVKRQFHA